MRMLIIGIACLLSSIVLQPAYSQQAPGFGESVPPPPTGVDGHGQGAPPAIFEESPNLIGPAGAQQWKIEQLRNENALLKQKIDLLEQLLRQQGDKP